MTCLRSTVFDITRRIAWPAPFTGRTLRNAHVDRWFGREIELDEVFLYQSMDGSILFRSSRLSNERVQEIAEEALRIDRSKIHDIIGYDC